MSAPQFARRALSPMQPESYRAAARRLRKIADKLEARAGALTPHEMAARTNILHTLGHFVRALIARHDRRPLHAPEHRDDN